VNPLTESPLRMSDFEYELPPGLIAQEPIEPRDSSRLLVLHRSSGRIEHRLFSDLPGYLGRGDLLACNQSRVLPARLYAEREGTGGRVELLLLRRLEPGRWEALARPARRARAGRRLLL